MSSTTSTSITFAPTCNRARPYLLLFSLYAMGAGTLLVVRPSLILDLPLLNPIEQITGLPHMPTPTTLEGQQSVSIIGVLAAAMGLVYGLSAGPYWEYGGKVFAQMSIDGRLIFATATFLVSFFTPYGSSFLFAIGFTDALIALATQAMVGGRKELIGQPQRSGTHRKKRGDDNEG